MIDEPRPVSPSKTSATSTDDTSTQPISPETVLEAATAAIEDPKTHKLTEIGPTKPPKHFSKAGTLMSKAAANISTSVAQTFLSQIPMLATSAGQSILSGSMATVVGAVDVVRSNNKKRSVARVLPSVGLAMIPGVGLPLAIGLGMASSYSADKIYTKSSKKDRKLELDQFWPTKYEFTKLKDDLSQVWVNKFTEIADKYCQDHPEYKDKAKEVIEVILWLLKSLTKLKQELLADWRWEKTSISVFDKNMKQISKGLKVSSIEVKEICKVVVEGTEKFRNKVAQCAKKTGQGAEELRKDLQTMEGYVVYVEDMKIAMMDAIKDAQKYLKDEQKRLV